MTKTVSRPCEHCRFVFSAPLKEVNRGNGRFCCIFFSYQARKQVPEPNVRCAQCDKPFYLNRSKQKNSKSGLFFCCREHKDLAQRIGGIQAIQPDHYGTGYRALAWSSLPHKCNRCGYRDVIDILQVHHRDHNHSNNELSNLEILCPNCHAIEHK
jgi:5-methylcytosine-specific restriction endonuclease McrA